MISVTWNIILNMENDTFYLGQYPNPIPIPETNPNPNTYPNPNPNPTP